jgi:hypothetical protein
VEVTGAGADVRAETEANLAAIEERGRAARRVEVGAPASVLAALLEVEVTSVSGPRAGRRARRTPASVGLRREPKPAVGGGTWFSLLGPAAAERRRPSIAERQQEESLDGFLLM